MEDLEEEEAYIPENETKPTKLSITNYGFEEQKYELFCTLKKSIFDSIYSNAINYVLSPRNSSTQRISGCAPSILWLQNESLLDRKELLGALQFASATLSYAEVAYETLGDVLFRLVKIHGLRTESSINRFVDLGSGGGKAVFAAYFTGLFFSCMGIELLPRLHRASKQYLRFFKRQILSHDEADELTAEKKIDFVQCDFTYLDWSAGVAATAESGQFHEGGTQEEEIVVVLAIAASFDLGMRRRVALIANRLPVGSFFICTTYNFLDPDYFEVLESFEAIICAEVFPERSSTQSVFILRRNANKRARGHGVGCQVLDGQEHLQVVLSRTWDS